MGKTSLTNRKGETIVAVVDTVPDQKGLVFVMHGHSGNKEEPHIRLFAKAARENGYTTIRFDTTNTFGESDGAFENATVTSYFEDLQDVIQWAKSHSWYREPFILIGHSLGGIATMLYAAQHPHHVKALAPVSSVISGALRLNSPQYADIIPAWQKSGWLIESSSTSPTGTKKTPWSYMLDNMKYDMLEHAHKLTMPVLLVVGKDDTVTPPEHQRELYQLLPGKRELHIISRAPHTFRDEKHLEQIRKIIDTWLKKTVEGFEK